MWFQPERNSAVTVSVVRAVGREPPRASRNPSPAPCAFLHRKPARHGIYTPPLLCGIAPVTLLRGGGRRDGGCAPRARRSGPDTGREDDEHHRGCQDGHGLAATRGTGRPGPRHLARARYRHQDRGDAGGSRTGQKPADHRPPLVPGGCRRRHRRMGCRNADQR